MPIPNFTILYVDNPPASADFYAGLLGQQPVETSPTFALFALPSGLMLGLWSRHTVEPAATAAAAPRSPSPLTAPVLSMRRIAIGATAD